MSRHGSRPATMPAMLTLLAPFTLASLALAGLDRPTNGLRTLPTKGGCIECKPRLCGDDPERPDVGMRCVTTDGHGVRSCWTDGKCSASCGLEDPCLSEGGGGLSANGRRVGLGVALLLGPVPEERAAVESVLADGLDPRGWSEQLTAPIVAAWTVLSVAADVRAEITPLDGSEPVAVRLRDMAEGWTASACTDNAILATDAPIPASILLAVPVVLEGRHYLVGLAARDVLASDSEQALRELWSALPDAQTGLNALATLTPGAARCE